MNLFGWIFVVLTALGCISKINDIGKPRKPVTAAEASLGVLFNVLLVLALYHWGLR